MLLINFDWYNDSENFELKILNFIFLLVYEFFFFFGYRFGIKMPKIIDDSVTIISGTAIGLSMFNIGMYPRDYSCHECLFFSFFFR